MNFQKNFSTEVLKMATKTSKRPVHVVYKKHESSNLPNQKAIANEHNFLQMFAQIFRIIDPFSKACYLISKRAFPRISKRS